MRITRVYLAHPLQIEQEFCLPEDATRHLVTVLRINVGEQVILFNGDGYDYLSVVTTAKKNNLAVKVIDKTLNLAKPQLNIHLAQAVCRGEKMDFVVQKATELGVSTITPIISEFSNVKLSADRWAKKVIHWQKVANSACEQSGRADLVQIQQPVDVHMFLQQPVEGEKLILNPTASAGLSVKSASAVTLLVGPEGGFSDIEIKAAEQQGYCAWQLGWRVLRSETAGLATISVLQALWGDFATFL
jgi:16S rRNA (uracil1498-N3)-methyltransferase